MAEIYHLCSIIFKPLNLLMILCVKNPAERQGFRFVVHALAWSIYDSKGRSREYLPAPSEWGFSL